MLEGCSVTKEDRAFQKWLEENTNRVGNDWLRKFKDSDKVRKLFDDAYNLGWMDCYEELIHKDSGPGRAYMENG